MARLTKADELKMREIAEKHNLTFEQVKEMVSSQYSFIREKTKSLDFKEGLTREEFDAMKTNFNIPSIGKLNASFYIYSEINKKKEKKD